MDTFSSGYDTYSTNELSSFLLVDLLPNIFLNALEISPFLAPDSTLNSVSETKELLEIA